MQNRRLIVNSFAGLVQSEFLKTRKTFAFWLAVLGGILIPTLVFLVVKSNPNMVTNPMSPAPWQMFLKFNWQSVAAFLLPLYIVLLTALVVQTDYKANALKKMLTLPISRTSYYLAKFSIVLFYVALTHIIFFASILIFGLLLGVIVPETQFLDKPMPLSDMFTQITKSFIAAFGMVSIQFLISIRFKNFIKPIGIGFAATVAGSIMLLGWEYADFWPWILPAKVSPGIMQGAAKEVFTKHELISLGYFVLFTIFGIFYFSRRNIQ